MLNQKFFDHILQVEGGWSDHPSDSGGATMMGITKRTYEAWLGRSVSKAELRAIPKKDVLKIYQTRYYDVNKTGRLENEFCQLALFDQAVNRGPRTAAKLFQETCNLYGKKLAVDGRMGNLSLAAANSIDPKDLGMDFIQRAQHGYVNIVKSNKSQIVFLSGWLNRSHVLLDDYAGYVGKFDGAMAKTPVEEPGDVIELDLFQKIVHHNPGISKAGLTRALTFIDHSKVKNKKVMTFVDFDLRSNKDRMWVIDMRTGKSLFNVKVAHGKYSDPNHDGYADKYSNRPGSGMSSLGAMIVGEPYGKGDSGWSKFQTATKLRGLEVGLNDNVYKRAVVFHDSKYVNDANNAISGRSLGCFAVDDAVARKIQSVIKNGSLIYAWDKDFLAA